MISHKEQERAINFISEWLARISRGNVIDMTSDISQNPKVAALAEKSILAIKVGGGLIKQKFYNKEHGEWTRYPNLLRPCCGNPLYTTANNDIERYSLDDTSQDARDAHNELAYALDRLGISEEFSLDRYGPVNSAIFNFMHKLSDGSSLENKYNPFPMRFRSNLFSSKHPSKNPLHMKHPRKSHRNVKHPRKSPRNSRRNVKHPRKSHRNVKHPRKSPRKSRRNVKHPRKSPLKSRRNVKHPRKSPRKSSRNVKHPRKSRRKSRVTKFKKNQRETRKHILTKN